MAKKKDYVIMTDVHQYREVLEEVLEDTSWEVFNTEETEDGKPMIIITTEDSESYCCAILSFPDLYEYSLAFIVSLEDCLECVGKDMDVIDFGEALKKAAPCMTYDHNKEEHHLMHMTMVYLIPERDSLKWMLGNIVETCDRMLNQTSGAAYKILGIPLEDE